MTEKFSADPNLEAKESIKQNLAEIFSAVKNKSITVMAATKTVPAELINYAINECGLTDIGENRVQELLDKYDSLSLDKARLHFIGTLQPNKVKYIIGRVCLIHSLDSMKLASEINKRSISAGLVTDVLCEINIGNEEAKGGIPEDKAEDFIISLKELSGIRVRGLMVIGPHCENKDDYRPFFARTKALFDRLSALGLLGASPILSMGMSDNYDLAAEYGATLIRPGSAIFGKRIYR